MALGKVEAVMTDDQPDIVSELDRWLLTAALRFAPVAAMLQRARDEIVALRKRCETAYSTVQINEARRHAERERDAEWKEWLYSSDPAGTPAFRALKEAVAEERERLLACAQYDALMEGPKFKSWNRSALDRLRVEYERSRRDPT